jgi:DNA-binding transcriptional MocR family regulator
MTPLARSATQTLTDQLAGQFAERIRQRLLPPGTRLPSVRDCAQRHGVSPHTVVAAYDRLLAQGLVEARRQRGFFVRERALAPVAGSLLAQGGGAAARGARGADVSGDAAASADGLRHPGPPLPAPVDAPGLIRGMFLRQNDRPSPGLGTLPPDWLDGALLTRTLRAVLARGDEGLALRYSEPAGDAALREVLAGRLGDIGVRAAPGQLVTACGATHALDIVSRALLAPGDAVLVDEPGWAVEYARLTQLGMRLLPVPRGADGPDLAVMEALATAHRPRLYVTVSVLHNPTGHSLTAAAAHRVLQLAQAHDFHVIEDDTYAHLAPALAPRLAALDGLRRTVYISGFSKILTPAWRVGYLAAPEELVDRFIDVKLLSTLATPPLMERAMAHCLGQGLLRRHAERVGERLDAARSRATTLALKAGCRFITPPQGLFGWVDTGMDTEALALRLLDQGWLLAPGTLFHATRRPSTLMRINFATSQDAAFWKAFTQARASMR